MFMEFMQMGFPAALAIGFIVGAPVIFYSVIAINVRARRGQEQDFEIKRIEQSAKVKQIEAKRNET